MNVVMLSNGGFVEVQGTGEHGTFDRAGLDSLLDLAVTGCKQLSEYQAAALAQA
jgi:ribonuclease PH